MTENMSTGTDMDLGTDKAQAEDTMSKVMGRMIGGMVLVTITLMTALGCAWLLSWTWQALF